MLWAHFTHVWIQVSRFTFDFRSLNFQSIPPRIEFFFFWGLTFDCISIKFVASDESKLTLTCWQAMNSAIHTNTPASPWAVLVCRKIPSPTWLISGSIASAAGGDSVTWTTMFVFGLVVSLTKSTTECSVLMTLRWPLSGDNCSATTLPWAVSPQFSLEGLRCERLYVVLSGFLLIGYWWPSCTSHTKNAIALQQRILLHKNHFHAKTLLCTWFDFFSTDTLSFFYSAYFFPYSTSHSNVSLSDQFHLLPLLLMLQRNLKTDRNTK